MYKCEGNEKTNEKNAIGKQVKITFVSPKMITMGYFQEKTHSASQKL